MLVGAILWLPVIIEQAAFPGRKGNISRTWRYFTETEDPSAGLATGSGLWASEFRFPPPWLGGDEPIGPFGSSVRPSSLGWLLVPVALIGVAVWCNRRRPSRSTGRFAGLLVVAAMSGIAAMSGLRGETAEYLFVWRSLLATLLLASLLLLIASGTDHRPLWRGAGLLVAALLVVAAAGTARSVGRYERGQVLPYEPVAAEALARIEARGLPTERVLIRGSGIGGLMEGVLDELDRRGVPVRVDGRDTYKWGRGRGATPDEVGSVWYVVQHGRHTSDLSGRPGADVLFRTTPLAEADEAELVRLQRRLIPQLWAADRRDTVGYLDDALFPFVVAEVEGLDRAAVDRIGELNLEVERSGRCRCAVVAFPASAADELRAEVDLYRTELQDS